MNTAKEYAVRIDNYFEYIKGEFHIETKPGKSAKETVEEKIWDRPPEPPLITGLALYLGFTSLNEFEAYTKKGKLAKLLNRAKLRVENEYEKKLHMQAPTGAIFALKKIGWTDERDKSKSNADMPATIHIKVHHCGPQLAGSEKEIDIDEHHRII
jgi:hypothetical protein